MRREPSIGSHCARHAMHLYEDLVIAEVVDDRNQLVPPGSFGAKVLVTVLFSRTQPWIRYETSDSIASSAEECARGLPFATLAGVQGRREETLRLPDGRGGFVDVRPNVFHRVLESIEVRAWQGVLANDGLRLLLAGRPRVSSRRAHPRAMTTTLSTMREQADRRRAADARERNRHEEARRGIKAPPGAPPRRAHARSTRATMVPVMPERADRR